MTLDDAKVYLAVADNREERPGNDLGEFAEIPEAEILDEELLLIDGRGCQQRRIDALSKPLRSQIARIAELPCRFGLVSLALRLPVSE